MVVLAVEDRGEVLEQVLRELATMVALVRADTTLPVAAEVARAPSDRMVPRLLAARVVLA
jgi:hypothetical protein